MTLADEDVMLQYLLTFGWRTQMLVYWLEQERDVEVSRSSMTTLLCLSSKTSYTRRNGAWILSCHGGTLESSEPFTLTQVS